MRGGRGEFLPELTGTPTHGRTRSTGPPARSLARGVVQDFADVTTGESRRAAGDEWDGGGSALHGEEGRQPEELNKILYTAAAHRVAVGQKKGETITYV